MKTRAFIALAILLITGMCWAQAAGTPAKPAQTGGSQAPAAQPSGSASLQPTAGAQAAPAPAGPHAPQAKTQEEFKAFQDAATIPDPAAMEKAADDFAAKFPQSELKPILYQRLMSMYQNSNNTEKTLDFGHKVLQMDPNNAAALVTVAQVLSNRTRDTDLDKDERWTEATKAANHALELIDSGAGIPPGTPPDRVPMFKNLVKSMAYASLGTVEFNKKNFPEAEKQLRQSVEVTGIQQDPVSWLQLSLALDRQNKYTEALEAANKCVQIAQGHPAGTYCQQEQARLQKLTAPGAPPASAPKPAAPPTSPQPSTSQPK